MRLYDIAIEDVESALECPVGGELDSQGNPRIYGPDRAGRMIIAVVANDDTDFLITTFPDGKKGA